MAHPAPPPRSPLSPPRPSAVVGMDLSGEWAVVLKQRAAQQLGGACRAAGPGPGSGSEFRVSLSHMTASGSVYGTAEVCGRPFPIRGRFEPGAGRLDLELEWAVNVVTTMLLMGVNRECRTLVGAFRHLFEGTLGGAEMQRVVAPPLRAASPAEAAYPQSLPQQSGAGPPRPAYCPAMSTIGVVADDTQCIHIAPGSPAALAGVRPGDHIVAVSARQAPSPAAPAAPARDAASPGADVGIQRMRQRAVALKAELSQLEQSLEGLLQTADIGTGKSGPAVTSDTQTAPAQTPPTPDPAPAAETQPGPGAVAPGATGKHADAAAEKAADPAAEPAVEPAAEPAAESAAESAAELAAGDASESNVDGFADILYKVVKDTASSDKQTVYDAAEKVVTQEEWAAAKDAFKSKYPDLNDGDLMAALKGGLGDDEVTKVQEILLKNGVQWE